MGYPGSNQVASLFLCAVMAALVTPAHSATRIDSSFAPQLNRISGYCQCFVQPGGKVYVTGAASDLLGNDIKNVTVNGQPLRGFLRLNANGSVDQPFSRNLPVRSSFSGFATAPDGSVVASGYYESRTQQHNGIFRLRPDGTYDSDFAGPENGYPLSLQADGKILAEQWNYGKNYLSVIRLNTNGSIDDTFVYSGGSTSTTPTVVIPLSTGQILVGLRSTLPPRQGFGEPVPTFIRLNIDGSADNSFTSPYLGKLQNFTTLPDGRIVFLATENPPILHRMSIDGVIDPHFQVALPGSWYGHIAAQSDGRVICAASNRHSPTCRINTDGTIDSTFMGTSLTDVDSIGVTPDDKIVVGGYIPDPEWQFVYVARFNANGTRDNSYLARVREPAIPAYISTQPTGKILVAGAINRVEGLPRRQLARLTTSGRLDRSYSPNLPFIDFWDIHFNSRGDVLFSSYSSSCVVDANGAARWIADELASAIENDGSVLAASDVIRRMNVNGTWDKELEANSPRSILSVTPLSTGKLLAIQDAGYPQSRLLRLNHNGTIDTTFSCKQNVASVFYEQGDGKIYVGLDEQSYLYFSALARLNRDGSADGTFTWPFHDPAEISAVAVDSRSRVLVAGSFQGSLLVAGGFQGSSYGTVVRLLANGTIDPNFHVQTDGYVSSIALLPPGRLVIGGLFSQVNGIPRSNIACVFEDTNWGALKSVPRW